MGTHRDNYMRKPSTGAKTGKKHTADVNARVNKHRAALRAAGLRPLQIWVPDTRSAHFASECKRQSLLIAETEAHDHELAICMDQALEDIEGWEN